MRSGRDVRPNLRRASESQVATKDPSRCAVLDDLPVALERGDRAPDGAGGPGTTRLRLIRERFSELHGRLAAGEVGVADELCTLLAPELRRQVRPRDPRISPEAIEEAIDDTLTLLVRAPARCDPARGNPVAWLVTVARNKVLDAARAITRRREVPLTGALERVLETPTESRDLAERSMWIERHRRLVLAAARTEAERRLLEARLRGAPAAEQADALGAADLPENQQRALVNRVWQRLRRRLLRSLPQRG
jgi:DNA-directed RNA polymerase specialized sigma24 family protein